MSQEKYLIVVEIERKGFLLKIINNLKEAESFAEKVFELSTEYKYSEMYKVQSKFKYFASYEIHGNQVYFGKSVFGRTDGTFSVSITRINMDTFCIKSFIKERENHSSVFELESYPETLLEKFPNMYCIIAN